MLFSGWYQMISCPDCDLPPIEREGNVQQRAGGRPVHVFGSPLALALFVGRSVLASSLAAPCRARRAHIYNLGAHGEPSAPLGDIGPGGDQVSPQVCSAAAEGSMQAARGKQAALHCARRSPTASLPAGCPARARPRRLRRPHTLQQEHGARRHGELLKALRRDGHRTPLSRRSAGAGEACAAAPKGMAGQGRAVGMVAGFE